MSRPRWVRPLGKQLQSLMDERDWSQETVMKHATSKVSTKTVSNILRGRDGTPDYTPRGDSVRAVFSAFGVKGVEALREVGLDEWANMLAAELQEAEFDGALREVMRAFREDPEALRDYLAR